MNIKIIDNIDISPILEAYRKIESKLEWLEGEKTRQCAIQHRKDVESLTEGCGKLISNKEVDYKHCNREFEGTVFEEIIAKYKLTRTRLMWVAKKSCYTLHKDSSPRIHIPLITNPSAMFVFKESGLHHLEVGKVYWVDTRLTHSFANFGIEDRLHLIGCV